MPANNSEKKNMIEDQHLPALEGMFPSWITTSSNDGEPNTTVISQIWFVSETEVALSFQFFNKTKKNISQNPYAFATIVNPASFDMYNLELKYSRTESEGDLFDEMDMKLEAIASMSGMSGIFELKGADIYNVLSINKIN
jgi:flavin reductase (DIM6/NTAB) family NADH-FMN oxidoreductase RutF|tara:strand:+ start:386 stop:805 length:420 start_codon:yes stop_codon:yes gene_type:complete